MNNLENIIYKTTIVPHVEISTIVNSPLQQPAPRPVSVISSSVSLQDRSIKELTISLLDPLQKPQDNEISLLGDQDKVDQTLQIAFSRLAKDSILHIKASKIERDEDDFTHLVSNDGLTIYPANGLALLLNCHAPQLKKGNTTFKIDLQIPDAATPPAINTFSLAHSFCRLLNAMSIQATLLAYNKSVEITHYIGTQITITPKTTKYDWQVSISLQAIVHDALSWKALFNGLPNDSIFLPGDTAESNRDKLLDLDKLTHLSRVYFIGHGLPGCTHIFNDENTQSLSANKCAAILVAFAPQLVKTDDGERIKISLVVCNSGDKSTTHESFAYQLSRALDKIGIPATVIGRHGSVQTHLRPLQKSIQGVGHHKNGTKSSFVTINGKTTITPIKYN